MTILVFENESTIRKVLKFTLQKQGYKILEATNALEAQDIFNTQIIDCVLMDINPPVVSSIKFIKFMKTKNKDCPLIILTSHGEQLQILHKNGIIPDKTISKDLHLSTILIEIDELVSKSRKIGNT